MWNGYLKIYTSAKALRVLRRATSPAKFHLSEFAIISSIDQGLSHGLFVDIFISYKTITQHWVTDWVTGLSDWW